MNLKEIMDLPSVIGVGDLTSVASSGFSENPCPSCLLLLGHGVCGGSRG